MAVNKTEKKPVYIRCPRCELNYCLKKDKYCSVCRAEMEGDKDAFVDDLELELCPICKTNYIQTDEIMCATCLKERQDSNEVDDINAEEWDAYANREDNDDFTTEEEETGEMASISDLDSDVIGDDDLGDDDLGFGLDLDDSDLDDDDDEKDDDYYDDSDFDDDFETIPNDYLNGDFDDDDDDYDEKPKPKSKSKKK